ncbi:MAG TPA: alpha/beta hydrolase-fold protein [Dermatophilaceae bacterium]|nr:alpha/beta hydrolase-fold protein [Dermatophilaceae bacterium]
MGGFGTLSYAARHPGMFSAAASYSGVVDIMDSGREMYRFAAVSWNTGSCPAAPPGWADR